MLRSFKPGDNAVAYQVKQLIERFSSALSAQEMRELVTSFATKLYGLSRDRRHAVLYERQGDPYKGAYVFVALPYEHTVSFPWQASDYREALVLSVDERGVITELFNGSIEQLKNFVNYPSSPRTVPEHPRYISPELSLSALRESQTDKGVPTLRPLPEEQLWNYFPGTVLNSAERDWNETESANPSNGDSDDGGGGSGGNDGGNQGGGGGQIGGGGVGEVLMHRTLFAADDEALDQILDLI
ncbi:hypothetical protein [Caballeronia sp. LZ065]|uniref:hypothetical protein n=1 Tax=Caballeronia sp. LZ065 TaxID=3038571 RepID=UPI00286BF207|nr:hypothetical protein [Caballeronia sp. LZ065]